MLEVERQTAALVANRRIGVERICIGAPHLPGLACPHRQSRSPVIVDKMRGLQHQIAIGRTHTGIQGQSATRLQRVVARGHNRGIDRQIIARILLHGALADRTGQRQRAADIGGQQAGAGNGCRNRGIAAQLVGQSGIVDDRVRRQRAAGAAVTDLQRAAADRCRARIGIVPRQGRRAGADLEQRARARQHTRIGGVGIVGADDQLAIAEIDIAAAAQRTEALVVAAQCQLARIIHRHSRSARQRIGHAEGQRPAGHLGRAGIGLLGQDRQIARSGLCQPARTRHGGCQIDIAHQVIDQRAVINDSGRADRTGGAAIADLQGRPRGNRRIRRRAVGAGQDQLARCHTDRAAEGIVCRQRGGARTRLGNIAHAGDHPCNGQVAGLVKHQPAIVGNRGRPQCAAAADPAAIADLQGGTGGNAGPRDTVIVARQDQRAAIDGGRTGERIVTGQRGRAGPFLGEVAAGTGHRALEGGGVTIATRRQRLGAQIHRAAGAGQRADGGVIATQTKRAAIDDQLVRTRQRRSRAHDQLTVGHRIGAGRGVGP